jgi:hypothetical protein
VAARLSEASRASGRAPGVVRLLVRNGMFISLLW